MILQGRKKLIAGPVLFVFLRVWGTVRFFIYVIYPYSDCNLLAKVLAVLHVSMCLNDHVKIIYLLNIVEIQSLIGNYCKQEILESVSL